MENLTKEQLLIELKDIFIPGTKVIVKFSAIAAKLQIEKDRLDTLLNELETDRKINQFIRRSSDIFILQVL